jgi:hypothetical protein
MVRCLEASRATALSEDGPVARKIIHQFVSEGDNQEQNREFLFFSAKAEGLLHEKGRDVMQGEYVNRSTAIEHFEARLGLMKFKARRIIFRLSWKCLEATRTISCASRYEDNAQLASFAGNAP